MTNEDAPTISLPAFRPAPPAEPEPAGLNRNRVVAVVAVAAVLLAGAAAVAYTFMGDVPRGTRVLGVEVGAKSQSEAERTLSNWLAARSDEPVKVSLAGRPLEIQPAQIGLTLDVPATVKAAASGPVKAFGTHDATPVVTLDQAKLRDVLRAKLGRKQLTIKQPAIGYDGRTPKVSYGAPGRDLDPVRAAAEVSRVWLTPSTADVPLIERPPAMSREQVDEVVRTVAEPAVAAPVTVRVPNGSFTLGPAAIAKSLVFRADDAGQLKASIDHRKLRAAAPGEFARVEKEPKEASVALKGGKPKIIASIAGSAVDVRKLGTDLLAVLPDPGPRQVTGELVTKRADITDEDIAKFGIKEKVSTFTTRFTGGRSSPRSQNIITIAREVDGAVVGPGETFSLNRHTGERNYAAGYQDAPVIVGGKLEPGVGGGASQFTTTLFNAAYYAGLQDVEHKPHSFYFDRYPAVIEATIFYPTLDLKFKNTTPYGILIDTATTGSTVTVTMWSTRYYDSVKTERSARRNITAPPTVHREDGPKCIATSGLPGFTQDAWRIIRRDGAEVKREKFTWRYDPEPRFICDAKKKKK